MLLKSRAIFSSLLIILLFASCSSKSSLADPAATLDKIKNRGWINVGMDFRLPGMGQINLASGEIVGFEADLARIISKELFGDPNKARFIHTPAVRRIPYLLSGEVDIVIAGLTVTEKRAQVISFSVPYFEDGQAILVKKGSPIRGPQDLNGKTVAMMKESFTLEILQEVAPHAKPYLVENLNDAFSALKIDLVDALLMDEIALIALKSTSKNAEEYTILQPAFKYAPWAIGLRKNEPQLLEFINNILLKLMKNGEWVKLYNKYIRPLTGHSASPPL